jgi:predicted GTPase
VKYLKTWWLLVLALVFLPWVVLFVAGSIWFWEKGYLWHYLAISGVCTLVCWPLVKWLRASNLPLNTATVEPSWTWPPSGHKAWAEIEQIAKRAQDADLAIDRPEPLWNTLYEVLDVVARAYHPKSSKPALEVPVPHVLKVIELAAGDLREAFSENVPGSHILTLHDFTRLNKLATLGQQSYFLYRIAYFGLNPIAALFREARDFVGGKLLTASTDEVKRWAVGYFVKKAGFYAIQLYSGQLVLADVEFQQYKTPQSKSDAAQAGAQQEALAEEPLRVLVLGQVKAGKSSLVNALFGEVRAAVDIIPTTKHVTPYVLERDGIERAIILDTAGYEDVSRVEDAFSQLRDHLLECDLVLVACSVKSAARGADRRLLDELRAFFAADPHRAMPPVVVALTHIDALRPFAEWNPPYNLALPSNVKAKNILDALHSVAEDLAIEPEQVVPICLRPDYAYNVDEGLVGAILQNLNEAQRVRCLRCLRQYHEEEYWRQLWQQAANSGKLLWKHGATWALGRKKTSNSAESTEAKASSS